MSNSRTLALVATLLLSSVLRAADQETIHGEEGAEIDEYLKRITSWGFSGAVLVSEDDRVLLARGYGRASIDLDVANDVGTVFPLGAITKSFTAAAVARLVANQDLSYDDALPRFFDGVPEEKCRITLHQLLTHTSGLPSSVGAAAAQDGEPTPKGWLEALWASPLRFEPGTGCAVSNAAYVLLAMVIEKVAGSDYESFLSTSFFEPLEMRQTGCMRPAWDPRRLAHGSRAGGDIGTIVEHGFGEHGPSWSIRGSDGVHSTLFDLYRWHCALNEGTALSTEAAATMFTPYVGVGGNGSFGYGWTIEDHPRAGRVLRQFGDCDGVQSADLRRLTNLDVLILVLGNAAEIRAYPVADALIDVLFGSYTLPPYVGGLETARLDSYEGSFTDSSGLTFHVAAEGVGLRVVATDDRGFFFLHGGDFARADAAVSATQRTRKAFDAWERGDLRPFYEAFGDRLPPRAVEWMLSRVRSEMVDKYGRFQRFHVEGCRADPFGLMVVVRIEFERGSEVLIARWRDGALAEIAFEERWSDPTFRALAEDELAPYVSFASFDWLDDLEQRIRFEVGEDGEVAAILVEARDGTIRATRDA